MIKTWRSSIKIILFGLVAFFFSYIANLNLTLPLLLFCLYFYFKFRIHNFKNINLLNLGLLFLIILAVTRFIIGEGFSVFFIAYSAIPMLATLLFANLELSLLITVAVSFAVALISGQILTGIISLVSGVASSILVLDARKRTMVIRAGFIVGVVQAATLLLAERFAFAQPNRYLTLTLNGIISSIIVLGVLPVFEYCFNTLTNISLLEMADFNQPLLQRMILEAPGTYHHSLVVGNLSETAAGAVGANALLARVGAYYHDIGKLQKPQYFSENQGIGSSRHDTLSPTMSKLVIMHHVKEGIELAKRYKLNPRLINFIQQHHGTGLVFYFYRRALESLEEDEELKEEGFRYHGPKPDTKEAAIVLLADSVEAATRALKEPDPAKIEEVVHKVINNKFIDGQLDECELTLKDLEKISAVFIRILSGIYHSRVTYPESLPGENNHKKPAKENSHQSEKDKKVSS